MATLLRDVYRMVDRCIDDPALARRQEPHLASGLLCAPPSFWPVPAAVPRFWKRLVRSSKCPVRP